MRFSYIHLSDMHFCSQPTRQNALLLMKRRPRSMLDTGWAQGRSVGFSSLAKPASYVPAITSSAAQFCLERSLVSDGLIITGDLATTGMMADIGVAYSFVTDPAADGFLAASQQPTLNSSNIPIYIFPGNHDKYINERAAPNSKTFELKFADHMKNFGSGVGHWVAKKSDCVLGVIYADFCLLSRGDASDKVLGVYGQGRVYDHILKELVERTYSLRRKYKGIQFLWATHFAPFDCGHNLQLLDWSDVIRAAISSGVAATLCGHTHVSQKYQVDRHVVYCAGSAGCVDSESDSRLHVINVDLGQECVVSRESYRWDAGAHEFIFQGLD